MTSPPIEEVMAVPAYVIRIAVTPGDRARTAAITRNGVSTPRLLVGRVSGRLDCSAPALLERARHEAEPLGLAS